MSVHEIVWRVTDGRESRVIRRKTEVEALISRGASATPVRFLVRWREGERMRSKTFGRRRDAERFDADVKRRLEVGEPVLRRRDVPSLAELAEKWMSRRQAEVESVELALGTYSEQAGLLDRYVMPSLGHLPIIDLRPSRLDEWVDALRASGAPSYRIRRAASVLTRLLRYAVRLEYLTANPAREMELPVHRYRRGRAATPVQVERMRLLSRSRAPR